MAPTPNGSNSRSGTETVASGSGKNGSFPCESGPSATLAAREVTLADPAGASPDRPHCLDAALDYTKHGFSVILLHGIVDGHCTCGQPDCTSPGEHPIDSWKTAQTERASPEQLEAAFLRNPHANVGIVTGAVSGLVVVDIFGPYGLTSFSKIVDEPPNLPSVRTGNGHHVYGRYPGTALKNFVKTYPGLDGRADGGYVVAPPSRHASGKDYIWRTPLEDPLPELPAELLALFTSSGEQREPSPKRKSRRDDAGPLAGS